jgi:hypothetical protein
VYRIGAPATQFETTQADLPHDLLIPSWTADFTLLLFLGNCAFNDSRYVQVRLLFIRV